MAQTARPQLVAPRSEEEQGTLRQIFENPKVVNKLSQAVPRHLNPQRMLRVLALAVQNTPKLAQAQPMTLLGAMMVCSSLGLEPNTPLGHAYLIPFDRTRRGQKRTEINLIIGYKGYIDLARRSGNLVAIHADVVYGASDIGRPGDQFSFEYGSDMHLRHVPMGDREGPKLWAYAHAKLKDGQAFEVLPYRIVLETARDISEAYKYAVSVRAQQPRTYETSPWVAYEHPMAAKTMIRRLSSVLPMSIEFANAVALDQMSEVGKVDFAALADGFDMGEDNAFQLEPQEPEEGTEAGRVQSPTGEQTGPSTAPAAASAAQDPGTAPDRPREDSSSAPPSEGVTRRPTDAGEPAATSAAGSPGRSATGDPPQRRRGVSFEA